jgi:hypothetical protein
MGRGQQQLAFQISQEDREWLKVQAEETGVSVAEVIRIRLGVKTPTKAKEDERKK